MDQLLSNHIYMSEYYSLYYSPMGFEGVEFLNVDDFENPIRKYFAIGSQCVGRLCENILPNHS
jgi:hypothetical protein